jgi:hypothetical protein
MLLPWFPRLGSATTPGLPYLRAWTHELPVMGAQLLLPWRQWTRTHEVILELCAESGTWQLPICGLLRAGRCMARSPAAQVLSCPRIRSPNRRIRSPSPGGSGDAVAPAGDLGRQHASMAAAGKAGGACGGGGSRRTDSRVRGGGGHRHSRGGRSDIWPASVPMSA